MSARPAAAGLVSLGALPCLAALLCLLVSPRPTAAQDLVADVSDHLVAITTGFAGTDLLVFGALSADGEVVVVIRGPARPTKLYRKSPVLGVWLNSASMIFPQAPSYYAVAASAPLEEIATPSERKRLKLGIGELELQTASPVSPNLLAEWRDALVRAKSREGLYQVEPGEVVLLSRRLFRTSVDLPTNLPVGTYLVDAYLFQDGIAIAAQTLPLVVSKVGFEAEVYNFAHKQGALYGVAAIAIALLAGWIAHLLFRRN